MKHRAPAFQFYPRQFAGDDQVMGLDLEAIGAHILLMCAAASSPERYRIHADEYAIRMRLRNPSDDEWQRIKQQLLAGAWKVSADGQWWIQSGLERSFQKQKEFSDQQRDRANSRWSRKDATAIPKTSPPDAELMPEGMPTVCFSSSSSSSNHEPKGVLCTFNSTDVAQILCRENGWSGGKIVEALKVSVEFKSQEMPEASLEQVGEWLVKAFFDHEGEHGKFAGGPLTFFQQAKYPHSKGGPVDTTLAANDPAAHALSQMEDD
jgi:uncharacterized protein YdaU (DUF1376 family)